MKKSKKHKMYINIWLTEDDKVNCEFKVSDTHELDVEKAKKVTLEELSKLVACACDYKELRRILYSGVLIDRLHNKEIGRKSDIELDFEVDNMMEDIAKTRFN